MRKILFILIGYFCLNSPLLANVPLQSKSVASQLGISFEERTNYLNSFLFINQMINNKFFWELRGYYIYNYIVTAPPAKAIPLPSVKNEQNLSGSGGAGILGYNISLTSQVALLPFLRFQHLTNTILAYKDSLGNKLLSKSTTYYLGAKLTMEVNNLFSIYTQYYGGYQRNILHGSKYFATPKQPIINTLTSTFEIGGAYKITKFLLLTPYIQLVINGNNPNRTALNPPISHNGLTSSATVFALKLAYKF